MDKLKSLQFDLEIAEEEARCVQIENRSLAEQLRLREKENRESEKKLAGLQERLEVQTYTLIVHSVEYSWH